MKLICEDSEQFSAAQRNLTVCLTAQAPKASSKKFRAVISFNGAECSRWNPVSEEARIFEVASLDVRWRQTIQCIRRNPEDALMQNTGQENGDCTIREQKHLCRLRAYFKISSPKSLWNPLVRGVKHRQSNIARNVSGRAASKADTWSEVPGVWKRNVRFAAPWTRAGQDQRFPNW